VRRNLDFVNAGVTIFEDEVMVVFLRDRHSALGRLRTFLLRDCDAAAE
jgi:hypothetical protein